MLTRVTITGADDSTPAEKLIELSKEFPFVEWGLLFSPKKCGIPRFPSRSWRDTLRLCPGASELRLSAHFCGGYTRDTLKGENIWLNYLSDEYQRVQLNGFRHTVELVDMLLNKYYNVQEIILQARAKAGLGDVIETAAQLDLSLSTLWDPSGGRGVHMDEPWPEPPRLQGKPFPMGYAGGIGPDNVQDVLGDLADREEPYWIDMESKVRDQNNSLDLAKVRRVLEQADPFVHA